MTKSRSAETIAFDALVSPNDPHVLADAGEELTRGLKGELMAGLSSIRDRLTGWRLVAVRRRSTGKAHVRAIGVSVIRHHVVVTSRIRTLDSRQGLVKTRSGSIYALVGDRAGGDPTIQLVASLIVTLYEQGIVFERCDRFIRGPLPPAPEGEGGGEGGGEGEGGERADEDATPDSAPE